MTTNYNNHEKSHHKSITEKIYERDAERVRDAFADLVEAYLQPSYGSMSKRDFEILLFMKLQEIEAISKEPDLYDLITDLRISRTRARNMIYESEMRRFNEDAYLEEYKKLLRNAVALKDGDKVMIEIQNPLMSDYFKNKVKDVGSLTDGSFSPELVKLPQNAYIALLAQDVLTQEEQNEIIKAYKKTNNIKDVNFSTVMTALLSDITEKTIGPEVARLVTNHFPKLLTNFTDRIKKNKD